MCCTSSQLGEFKQKADQQTPIYSPLTNMQILKQLLVEGCKFCPSIWQLPQTGYEIVQHLQCQFCWWPMVMLMTIKWGFRFRMLVLQAKIFDLFLLYYTSKLSYQNGPNTQMWVGVIHDHRDHLGSYLNHLLAGSSHSFGMTQPSPRCCIWCRVELELWNA